MSNYIFASKYELVGVSKKGVFDINKTIDFNKVNAVIRLQNGYYEYYVDGYDNVDQDFLQLEGGKGYWLELKDGVDSYELNIEGTPIELSDIQFNSDLNWNLVALPNEDLAKIVNYLNQFAKIDSIITTDEYGYYIYYVVGYDDLDQDFLKVQENKGYWIFSKSKNTDITPPLPPDFNGTKPSNQ